MKRQGGSGEARGDAEINTCKEAWMDGACAEKAGGGVVQQPMEE